MRSKSNEPLLGRVIASILLLLLCLLPIGLFICLSSGKPISVGAFELSRRVDGQWSYRGGKAATFSASGTSLQTGQSYSFGPFRITHWTREWKAK